MIRSQGHLVLKFKFEVSKEGSGLGEETHQATKIKPYFHSAYEKYKLYKNVHFIL